MKVGEKDFRKLARKTQEEIVELAVHDKYVSDVTDKRQIRNLSKRTQEEIGELVLSDDYIEKEKQKIRLQGAKQVAEQEPILQFIEEKRKKEEEEQVVQKKGEEETIDIKLMRHNLGIDFDKEKKAVAFWDASSWAQRGEKYVDSDITKIKNIGTGYDAKFLHEIEQKAQAYLRQSFAEQERKMHDAGNLASHIMEKSRHISEIVGNN